MKKLLLSLVVLTGCMSPEEGEVIIKVEGERYLVKESSIIHTTEGCLSFEADKCGCGEIQKVTVCGNYQIIRSLKKEN